MQPALHLQIVLMVSVDLTIIDEVPFCSMSCELWETDGVASDEECEVDAERIVGEGVSWDGISKFETILTVEPKGFCAKLDESWLAFGLIVDSNACSGWFVEAWMALGDDRNWAAGMCDEFAGVDSDVGAEACWDFLFFQ